MFYCYTSIALADNDVAVIEDNHVTVVEDDSFVGDIDDSNQYVATKWDQLNRNVDMFFTNKKSPEENRSSIFVYSSVYVKEGQSVKQEYDFQLRFDLPNTIKKLRITIERQQDDIENALTDTSAPTKKAGSRNSQNFSQTENKYSAGANFYLTQTKKFISSVHFGIRLDMPLNPNLKLDLERKLTTKHFNIGLLQKLIYYRQEGFQEISQITFNRKFGKNFQIDQNNALVWTDESDVFSLRNSLVFYHDLGKERGMSYSLGANAKLSPAFYYESYDASVNYRQLLFRDWLYGTFTVGADFPKVSHFNDEKFIQFRLDVFFKE